MEKRIFLFVLSLHLFCLLFVFFSPSPPLKALPKKVAVTTKIIQEVKKSSSTHKVSAPASAPKPKPKPKPVAAPQQKKPAPKPVSKELPKPAPKFEKAKDLLKELESNIAGIESKLKHAPEMKPLTFEKMEVGEWEEGETNLQQSYFETISVIFRQSLTLPESGDVKLTITVQPNGEIAKIESVSSKSDVNLRYLEKTLPHLKLPSPPTTSNLSITVTFQS